jgi:fructokinase
VIIVSGENVADLLPSGPPDARLGALRASFGGGPTNTAVAAARLGSAVGFAGRFGADAFGRAFRDRLEAAGVDLRHAVTLAAPSSLALVSLDAAGTASYDFWLEGAADYAATPLPDAGPDDIRHIGSLAAYWPPGADVAERWIAHAPGTTTFDVNLRPIVLERQPDALERLERLVALADVVKASDQDLRLAYPEADPEQVARRWLSATADTAASLVVLTLGPAGALALTRDGRRVHVPAPEVEVADTIGAGDAAMGALLCRLAEHGLAGVCERLEETLRFVVAAASLACTRPGAYAPSADEVEARSAQAGRHSA